MNKSEIDALDQSDLLRSYRDKFELPEGIIYLDGNSLGALPKGVAERVATVVKDEWGQSLIKSWNVHDWYPQPGRVGDKIARLIGAEKGTVISADSTSINLFKLLTAAVRLNAKTHPERRVILSDTGNFPNDLYVIQGLVDLLGEGYEMRLVAPEEIAEALSDDIAAAVITQVDMVAAIKAAANPIGATLIKAGRAVKAAAAAAVLLAEIWTTKFRSRRSA